MSGRRRCFSKVKLGISRACEHTLLIPNFVRLATMERLPWQPPIQCPVPSIECRNKGVSSHPWTAGQAMFEKKKKMDSMDSSEPRYIFFTLFPRLNKAVSEFS